MDIDINGEAVSSDTLSNEQENLWLKESDLVSQRWDLTRLTLSTNTFQRRKQASFPCRRIHSISLVLIDKKFALIALTNGYLGK